MCNTSPIGNITTIERWQWVLGRRKENSLPIYLNNFPRPYSLVGIVIISLPFLALVWWRFFFFSPPQIEMAQSVKSVFCQTGGDETGELVQGKRWREVNNNISFQEGESGNKNIHIRPLFWQCCPVSLLSSVLCVSTLSCVLFDGVTYVDN